MRSVTGAVVAVVVVNMIMFVRLASTSIKSARRHDHETPTVTTTTLLCCELELQQLKEDEEHE